MQGETYPVQIKDSTTGDILLLCQINGPSCKTAGIYSSVSYDSVSGQQWHDTTARMHRLICVFIACTLWRKYFISEAHGFDSSVIAYTANTGSVSFEKFACNNVGIHYEPGHSIFTRLDVHPVNTQVSLHICAV